MPNFVSVPPSIAELARREKSSKVVEALCFRVVRPRASPFDRLVNTIFHKPLGDFHQIHNFLVHWQQKYLLDFEDKGQGQDETK